MRMPLLLIRLSALFSLLAGSAVFYDLIVGSPEHDSAEVIQKWRGGRGTSYSIQAQGHFRYNEGVSADFYKLCESGDTLQLSLTPVFKEWRHVSLVRGGSVLGETVGRDIFDMAGFGLVFLIVAGVSLFAPAAICQKPFFWISVSVINFVAVLLFLKYVAVLAKVYEKM